MISGLVAVVAIAAISRGAEEVEGFNTAGGAVGSVMASAEDGVDRPDACADSPAPGTLCSDGTIYAGPTSVSGAALFTTACDAGMSWDGASCVGTRANFFWNNGSSAGHVITGATDDRDGAANTAGIAGLDADSLTAGAQPHQAAEYCADLTSSGHSDWFLPANAQAGTLRTNREAIGNFVDHATTRSTGRRPRPTTGRRASDGWATAASSATGSTWHGMCAASAPGEHGGAGSTLRGAAFPGAARGCAVPIRARQDDLLLSQR